MAIIFYIVWFILGAAIFNGFHKVFDVAYFGCGGFITELLTIAVVSFYITAFIFGLLGVSELPV